jgi:predicted negative regulator of RcsB-dependent stress response
VSLKDELNYVKEELSSDEKLLESAFKLERFYKKNKLAIWAVLLLIVVGFGGKALYGAYQEHLEAKANEALLQLEKNPSDQAALKKLESANPKLYALYRYSSAVDRRQVKPLQTLAASEDPRIRDLAAYHVAVLSQKPGSSRYYHDLSLVEKAYEALKAGKKAEARSQLALIGENSPVAGIARLLRHATIQ